MDPLRAPTRCGGCGMSWRLTFNVQRLTFNVLPPPGMEGNHCGAAVSAAFLASIDCGNAGQRPVPHWPSSLGSIYRIQSAHLLTALPVRMPGTPIRLNGTNRFFNLDESGCQAPPRDASSPSGWVGVFVLCSSFFDRTRVGGGFEFRIGRAGRGLPTERPRSNYPSHRRSRLCPLKTQTHPSRSA